MCAGKNLNHLVCSWGVSALSLSYYALNPTIKVFSPWKDKHFLDQFKGRTDLLNYAEKHDIDISQSKEKPYSEDANLMHISHEAGTLEDPSLKAENGLLKYCNSLKKAPDKETEIEIHFKDGIPIKVINKEEGIIKQGSLTLFNYLNDCGTIPINKYLKVEEMNNKPLCD